MPVTFIRTPHTASLVSVPTENHVFAGLRRARGRVGPAITVVDARLATMIKCLGVERTQRFIDDLEDGSTKVFVCSHYDVHRLDWRANVMFSTNSSRGDGTHPLPDVPLSVDRRYRRRSRRHLFSFLGSTKTHPLRAALVRLFPEQCFDCGVDWGADAGLPPAQRRSLRRRHAALLGDSVYTVCPRGIAVSSIRVFEAIGMGSIPVILADGYNPPYSGSLDWGSFSVSVAESEAPRLCHILRGIPAGRVATMQARLPEIYDEYFAPDAIYKAVLEPFRS